MVPMTEGVWACIGFLNKYMFLHDMFVKGVWSYFHCIGHRVIRLRPTVISKKPAQLADPN
jgi:hypothetical protein